MRLPTAAGARRARGVRLLIVGIDYDSYGIYLARIGFDRGGTVDLAAAALRKRSESGRRGEWHALSGVRRCLERVDLLTDGRASLVYVERGFGMSRRADFTLGSIYGAIVASLTGPGSPLVVNSIDLQEWKKIVAGNGNAKKHDAHAALFVIAEEEGWPISDLGPDLLDALAIAYAGREANARAFG